MLQDVAATAVSPAVYSWHEWPHTAHCGWEGWVPHVGRDDSPCMVTRADSCEQEAEGEHCLSRKMSYQGCSVKREKGEGREEIVSQATPACLGFGAPCAIVFWACSVCLKLEGLRMHLSVNQKFKSCSKLVVPPAVLYFQVKMSCLF